MNVKKIIAVNDATYSCETKARIFGHCDKWRLSQRRSSLHIVFFLLTRNIEERDSQVLSINWRNFIRAIKV